MEENIRRGSKDLEMEEDLNLESRIDPSKSRKESGAYYQSSNINN